MPSLLSASLEDAASLVGEKHCRGEEGHTGLRERRHGAEHNHVFILGWEATGFRQNLRQGEFTPLSCTVRDRQFLICNP